MNKILAYLFLIILISFLFILPSKIIHAISASPILFIDNFNRPNSISLGENWTQFYGNQPAGIENDKAYVEVGRGGLWGFYKVIGLNTQDQDVSIKFIHQNGDTTLLARVIDINNRIAINYYQTGPLEIYEVHNGNYRLIPNSAPRAIIGEEYTFRVKLVGNSIKVWVNNNLYAESTLNYVTSGSAGFGANDGYTKVYFDDFVVLDGSMDPPISTPTPSPSSTPTPTSSPSPVIPIIPVVDLKQYAGGWENDLYDNVSGTIKQFGCALTAAAMILDYHGHKILPGELNNWLKQQPDGYIRNGLVNWLAVSRYTKDNYSPASRTLEYKRLLPTEENLDGELYNNRPTILKEDGHFVVATGKLTNTYTINDPGYSDRSTLSAYNNNYLAINSYTPSDSDLSYMMFVADKDIVFELSDSKGNPVSSQNFIEEPISDLNDPTNKSGEPLSLLILEKPASDEYKLKISGKPGFYTLDSYLYDINGNPTKKSFSGELDKDGSDIYHVYFGENNKTLFDKTPPSISYSISPLPNEFGWNKENATITWTVDDLESNFSTNGCNEKYIDVETLNITITCSASSLGGFSEKSAMIKLDKTKPTINIITPADGYKYIIGTTITPNWNVSDSLSGIKSTTTNHDALSNKFTVRTEDWAGNIHEKSHSYFYIYNFVGLLTPIKQNGNIFNFNRTIPIKFQLTNSSNEYIDTAVAYLEIKNGLLPVVSSGFSNYGNKFRYNQDTNEYIYNLSTRLNNFSRGRFELIINLDDGEKYSFPIVLR